MAKTTLKINSIFEGDAPSQYYGVDGTFISSIAIDPDYPISSSDIKPSGFLVPIAYTKFSGSNVTAAPVAIINTPKDTKTYTVLSNGRLVSYDSSLGSETLIGTVAGSQASGATYYNNFIYIFGTGASHDDVSRYGPLNNSPTLVDNIWKGATLGSLAALSNTTYPTLRGFSIPNHWGIVHGDNALYFLDFESKTGGSYPGQGLVHKISTKKTTNEGDTNGTTVVSAYGALRLPFGFYPTTLVSNSTNLMIIGIYSTDNTIDQGKASFVLWDPTNTTSFFAGPYPLPDTLATASMNANGTIYIWTGNAQGGVRMSKYLGGQTVQDVVLQNEGLPPMPGAVDAKGSRVIWGGFTTNPSGDQAVVWAYGSKDIRLPVGMHNIAKATSSGTTPFVTALKYVQQDSYKQPKVVIGWGDTAAWGLDKYSSSATLGSKIRWMFNIGQRFQIRRIRMPLAGAVGASTTITPTVYMDDLAVTNGGGTALPVINNTNFPAKRKILYKGTTLDGYWGDNNFVLELVWSSTDPVPVALPIYIDIDFKEEEND